MEGSKPTHGKDNRVLHPQPLSEKSGVGSPAKAREGNRVLHTSKEVGIAYGSELSRFRCIAKKLLSRRLAERFFPKLQPHLSSII
jgi:hypothetical protein